MTAAIRKKLRGWAYAAGFIESELDRAAEAMYAAIGAEVLAAAAAELVRTADEVEAIVAKHFGPASGIGPGSADMLRLAAQQVGSFTEAGERP